MRSYRVPVRCEQNGTYSIKFPYVRASNKAMAKIRAEQRAKATWPGAERYEAMDTGQYPIVEITNDPEPSR